MRTGPTQQNVGEVYITCNLGNLHMYVNTCNAQSTAQVVVLTGGAGLGKSALLKYTLQAASEESLGASAASARVLYAQSSALSENPLHSAAQWLRPRRDC